MAIPANLQKSSYGPGWALRSLWAARNALCLDLGGNYKDIRTYKIHQNSPLKMSVLCIL